MSKEPLKAQACDVRVSLTSLVHPLFLPEPKCNVVCLSSTLYGKELTSSARMVQQCVPSSCRFSVGACPGYPSCPLRHLDVALGKKLAWEVMSWPCLWRSHLTCFIFVQATADTSPLMGHCCFFHHGSPIFGNT